MDNINNTQEPQLKQNPQKRRRNFGKKKPRVADDFQPQGNAEYLDMPIEKLGLSDATLESLKNGRLETVRDIAKKRMSEMYRIQNIGKRNCMEVLGKLKNLNLSYREEEIRQEQNSAQPTQPLAAREQNVQTPRPAQSQTPQNNQGTRPFVGRDASVAKSPQGQNTRFNQNGQNAQQTQGNQNNRFNQNGQAGQGNQNTRFAQGGQGQNGQRQQNNNRQDNNRQNQNNNQKQPQGGKYRYERNPQEGLLGQRSTVRPPTVFEKVAEVRDTHIKYTKRGKWGFRDASGKVLIPADYDEVFSFKEDLACVEIDGLFGFIDRENNVVIEIKYECATSFSDGFAVVSEGEKSGYIDKEGKMILPFKYDVATGFKEGKALVRIDDRWGFIDKTGEINYR